MELAITRVSGAIIEQQVLCYGTIDTVPTIIIIIHIRT